jgi:hypothetical protein
MTTASMSSPAGASMGDMSKIIVDVATNWDSEHDLIAMEEKIHILRVQKVTQIMLKWLEVDPIKRNRVAILSKTFTK